MQSASAMTICSICHEAPVLHGLLSSCNHVFCLECIQHWHSKQIAASVSLEEAIILHAQNQRFSRLESTHELGPTHSNNVKRLEILALVADPARRTVTCPICRQGSNQIYPAVRLPDSSDQKKCLMQGHEKMLSTMVCKWYELSRKLCMEPFCPFGDACVYAHGDQERSATSLLSNEARCLGWAQLLQGIDVHLEGANASHWPS